MLLIFVLLGSFLQHLEARSIPTGRSNENGATTFSMTAFSIIALSITAFSRIINKTQYSA